MSKLSNRYLRPLLERDYVHEKPKNTLLSIENEEALRLEASKTRLGKGGERRILQGKLGAQHSCASTRNDRANRKRVCAPR